MWFKEQKKEIENKFEEAKNKFYNDMSTIIIKLFEETKDIEDKYNHMPLYQHIIDERLYAIYDILCCYTCSIDKEIENFIMEHYQLLLKLSTLYKNSK